MADSQKTEKATPKKRRDERKKGNIFFSNDAVSVAVLLGSFFTLRLVAPFIAEQMYHFLRSCLEWAAILPSGSVTGELNSLFLDFLMSFVLAAGPLMAVATLIGIAATLFQTKMLVSGESLRPKFSRINPLQGIRRLFSFRSIVEALKGLLKIGILLYLIYQFMAGVIDLFARYFYTDLLTACGHLFEESFSLIIQIGIAYVVLAAADVFYQWWDYERQIRMSKQEIKEEYKQTEGDPQIKGKIKEAQRKMAQSRMMQQVPQADVVIRNPTHFAVALRYRLDKDPAPVVLAKGQDEVAARIVRKAEECKIAIVENVALARALYASTELNREIPPELYNAVAEVLVYLYKMDQNLK